MIDKEPVLNGLRTGVVEVTFEKKDGSERVMRCTLVQHIIPEEKQPKGTGTSSSDTVQRVFDVDKQEWRSFSWDSVKNIEYV